MRAPRRAAGGPDAHALRRFLTVFSFLAVPVTLYAVWVIYPTLATLQLSFTDWSGVGDWKWVGLANFTRLLEEPTFRTALLNNLVWIAVFVTVPTAAGLALAVVLNTALRFDRFLKIAFYLPLVLATVVVALVWAWIYHPLQGLLNNLIFQALSVLRAAGLAVDPQAAFAIGWLGDPRLALAGVIGAAVWRQVGYVMILYLAGLKTVDAEVVEAARVDGAEGWTLFRHVTFPMLAPVTTIVVVISIIDSLRSFDMVYVMTQGGPFDTSQVLANYMYFAAFHDYRMGYAAAIAVVLFLISLAFIFAYLRQVMAQEEEARA